MVCLVALRVVVVTLLWLFITVETLDAFSGDVTEALLELAILIGWLPERLWDLLSSTLRCENDTLFQFSY